MVPTPLVYIPSILTHSVIVPNLPRVMATRFTPLVHPIQLQDLTQGYSQRIRIFSAEGDITTQKNLDRFNDFVDLEEVDHEHAKMILFAQIFYGDLKNFLGDLHLEVSMIFKNVR